MITIACSVLGCNRQAKSRGKCDMHYIRDRRRGIKSGLTRREKVLAFVYKCVHESIDSCMEWEIHKGQDYPTTFDGKRYCPIGHIVLLLTVGECPDGLEMRHLCGNAKCCNFRHLKWDTHIVNCADKQIHGTEYDRRGEKNSNAKLTKEQVDEIRLRYRKGKGPYDRGNCVQLANEYNVGRMYITMIVRGDVWQ